MSRIKTLEQIQAEEYEARNKEARPFQTAKLLIVYGRQSTITQFINNVESQQEQALDLLDYGARLGWPEELRLLFIENQLADGTIKNASGRLRIDQREGLQAVFALIKAVKVGAVLVSAVDRLFRDETQVQPAVFAEECRKQGVQILTLDGDVYDFNVPRRNDLDDFLDAAKEAANYLKGHLAMMHRRKERKALRGLYVGSGIPTGFMLEGDRKERNYIPNPVWAPVVARLLRRLRELGGNFDALRAEIRGKPIFPDLPPEIAARVGYIHLTKVQGGYTSHSWSGLRAMLTNVALIGHKVYKGRLIKNVHPPVTDDKDLEANFWYAFNLLSPTDINGNERKKIKRVIRKTSPALLSGIIQSDQGSVYVFQPKDEEKHPAYAIKHFDQGVKEFVASILVSELDQMFEEILLMRLATLPKNAPPPYDQLKAIQTTALVSVNEQIAKARIEHARLQREHDVNFDIMSDKELRENKLARNVLLQQIEELEQKVKDADRALEDAQEVQCLLRDAGETWRKKTLEEKRRYIRIITTGIWLNMVAPGWLKMEFYWSPDTALFNENECIIWQQNAGKGWSEEENEILRANYGSASRAWLIEHLPYRSWQSIRSQAYRLQVKRGQLREEYAALPDWLCLSDAQVLAEYPFIHLHRDTKQFHLWYTAVTKEHARSARCV